MRRPAAVASVLVIVVLALAVRLPTVTAGRPYINYVDEGNLLHPVARMLRDGRWEPRWYLYPSLPLIAVATAARLSAPWRAWDPRSSQLLPRIVYDHLDPRLLLTGRAVSLLASLGIVLLSGRLAWRLGGPVAGLAALLLTAFVPPLVIRGAIASVDPFAAFFALAALLFADRLRTSGLPAVEAGAAGAMAGLAMAAKYPAVAVALVPAWIVLRSARPWRQRLLLSLCIGVGLTAGAIAGMPGLVLHPDLVWAALQRQAAHYRNAPSPAPLWRQAFVRAEWDLPFEHPELGAAFVVLALAGVAAAWRDRSLRATAHAWSLYAGAVLALLSRYSFQPFRNLLPLVAPACILTALLYARMRSRLARPYLADAACGILVLSFAVPVAAYATARHRLRDSRVEAIDWLQGGVGPGDTVLVLSDLAVLPGEVLRLGVRSVERPWPRVLATLRHKTIRFVVASVPPGEGPDRISIPDRDALLAAYRVRAHFGEDPTPPHPGWWHGNRQSIYVLEKVPRARSR